MKKYISVIVMAMMMFTLSGCQSSVEEETTDEIAPNITVFDGETMGKGTMSYYYLVDNNTGVVYLVGTGHYRNSMTVMLNADGTPVTADQLGLTIEKE